MDEQFFPEIITKLRKADIPLDGVTSFLIQSQEQQILFMEFSQDIDIPEHSHAAQWGVVLDGEIELTIEGRIQTCQRGDRYFIPADAKHSAKIRAGYKDVTLFDQKDRYSVK